MSDKQWPYPVNLYEEYKKEIARLTALNAELLAACKIVRQHINCDGVNLTTVQILDAAIAKEKDTDG